MRNLRVSVSSWRTLSDQSRLLFTNARTGEGGDVEHIIARLLQDFERGKMNRRQLIQSLGLAATAASALSSVPAAAAGGLKMTGVDHISYRVSDYKRTRDFYADLFGLTVTDDTGTQAQLRWGTG